MPVALNSEIIAECREYLICLVRPKIPFDLRGRIDPSDVVQETLLNALRDLDKHKGQTKAEMMGWLKEILRCRLIDRFERLKLEPRAVSFLGEDWFGKTSEWMSLIARHSQSGPDGQLVREEDALLLAKMLAELSEAQAEAIVLKHCEGTRVAEIGRHMNKTPAAVGGLLRHGMKRLRELMPGKD
jgi:RNA polymerase sigma-70 factor (ECF subfamily)